MIGSEVGVGASVTTTDVTEVESKIETLVLVNITDDASVVEAGIGVGDTNSMTDAIVIETEIEAKVSDIITDASVVVEGSSTLNVENVVKVGITTDPSPIEIEERICVVLDDALCDVKSGIPDTVTNIKSLIRCAIGRLIPVTMTNETPRPPLINDDDTGVSMADTTNGVLGSINRPA